MKDCETRGRDRLDAGPKSPGACALLALGGLLALSGEARAQGGVNGSIVGYVFDQTGAPIKGVKVTARSETQIGGSKAAYTNDEGYVRLVGLLPGRFEATASAPKLRTVVQKGINVGIDAPAEINLVMDVETQVEEVKVVERAPIVSTTTANVKETFDSDFLEALPLEDRLGIADAAFQNVAGGRASSNGTYGVRGGGNTQNAFNVEGFNMTGFRVTDARAVPITSLAATEVHSAGYGAENATAHGSVINMVTKSGSNKFQIDLGGFVEDSNLKFFTDRTDVAAHSFRYHLNPSISGPIVKDRLWYFVTAEGLANVNARERDPSGLNLLGDPPPGSKVDLRGTAKLTWQATPRNKLTSYNMYQFSDEKFAGNANRDERDAHKMLKNERYFFGLIWESLLADDVFLRSQAGFQFNTEYEAPQRCRTEPESCDHITQFRQTFPRTLHLGNHDLHRAQKNRSFELINQIEWFAHSKTLGEHSIKAKSRVFMPIWEDAQSTPGDGYVQYNGTNPDRQRTYYSNDPRLEGPRYGYRIRGAEGLTTLHSLQDAMRLTRTLTFTPGLAYSTSHGSTIGGSGTTIDARALTPHVSAAWDATRDGRTVLRASFNQYIDPDAVRLSMNLAGDRVYRECLWNPDAQAFDRNCTYGGGSSSRTIGLPCGPSGINPDGTMCKRKLRTPKNWEYTFGAEREILPGVGLGTDVVYRLFSYPYELSETNRIWDRSGLALDRLGAYRNGRDEAVNDLSNPHAARRRYLGVTALLRKREGAIRANASYTWSRLEGNVYRNESNEFGNNPARDLYYAYGFLPDDYRHNVRASVVWQASRWLSTGYVFRYRSGFPYGRNFRSDVLGNFTDLRARTGTDPGGNINDPGDDRALRLPDIVEMNLQLRVNFKPLIAVNLESYVDAMNILALRTTTAVDQTDGPAWGSSSARMPPLRIRIGFRYRY